ncbi:MAG TPA: Wzz/FepE/Etk N-terminal domain-containing protein, partial [Gemmataceae bacterium]|nr:Wzz/FepE/Etk N-terminal domain-containing protein [Gemmataceae bacterium]
MKPHDQSYPEPTSNLPAGRPESRAIAGRIDRATTALAWDAAPAPALSGTPDLKTLLHGLRRRWFAAFILGTTLAALAAAIAWYLMSPKYTAVAQLRVLALPDKIIPDPHAGREEFKTYIRTIASQLKGRPVIKEALKQDKVVALKLENLYPEVLAFMEDELKVEFQETNEIMTVTLGSCDPNVSITVLKAILDAFNKLVPEAEETQRLGRIAKLEGALAKAKKDLEDLQKRMEFDAQQSKGIVDPRALPIALTFDINNLNQALADRNRVYNELLTARISLEAFLSHINSAQKEGGVSEAAVEAAINADAKMKLLQEGVRAQTRLLRQLGGTYLPSGEAAARKLKEMRAELEERRKEIREELKTRGKANLEGDPEYQRARMEIQIDALKRRGEELDKLVAELSAKVKDSGKVDPKLQELASEIKGKEALVADLTNLRDRDKVELEASRRIQVASDPDLQKKDIRKQLAVTIVAPVLTLVGVCMGLAWLECRQRRVRSANHIAQGLGIPVVGAVPNLPNLERHLVGPAGETDLQGHPVMESIDSLRTRLLREAESMS